jgi:iron uptake system component EfeO
LCNQVRITRHLEVIFCVANRKFQIAVRSIGHSVTDIADKCHKNSILDRYRCWALATNTDAGRKFATRGLEKAMEQVFFKAGAVRACYALTIAMFCLPVWGMLPCRADPLDDAAERYRSYMVEQIDQSLADARALRERLAAKDLEGAKREWVAARVGWERAEVFTSVFVPDLDAEIDAWPNAAMGFHAIEAELFGHERGKVDEQTDALIFHLTDLEVKVHLIHLMPQGLLNGTARLAYEIGESKADGGESRLSGTSLNDMRNNADGIALAYDVIFAPSLTASDPKLAQAAKAKIAELQTLVAVDDWRKLDSDKLRATSEELIVALQSSAPKIGLRAPTLEEIPQ